MLAYRFHGQTSAFRNSAGVTIFTPRNGLRRSKSASPVTIYVALPLMANSKTRSSSGSRHAWTNSVISIRSDSSIRDSRNSSRSSREHIGRTCPG